MSPARTNDWTRAASTLQPGQIPDSEPDFEPTQPRLEGIRAYADALGLDTAEALASAVGCDIKTAKRWIAGTHRPSITALRLLRAYWLQSRMAPGVFMAACWTDSGAHDAVTACVQPARMMRPRIGSVRHA